MSHWQLSFHLPQPDRSKLISWEKTKVRWLIYYYLVGLIAGVYIIGLQEFFIALPIPVVFKIIFVTVICGFCWSAASVWLYKKGWLR